MTLFHARILLLKTFHDSKLTWYKTRPDKGLSCFWLPDEGHNRVAMA